MAQLALQLDCRFNGRSLCFSILHQSRDIKDIIKVCLNLNLEVFGLGVSKFVFQVVIQSKLSKFVLKVYSKVHVFNRMDNNVDKLHTRDHKVNVKGIVVDKVVHKGLKAPPLSTLLLKMVKGSHDQLVTSLNEADCSEELENK